MQKTAYEISLGLVGSEMCIREWCVCVCLSVFESIHSYVDKLTEK
jgi:hypothetical protein